MKLRLRNKKTECIFYYKSVMVIKNGAYSTGKNRFVVFFPDVERYCRTKRAAKRLVDTILVMDSNQPF